MKKQTRLIRLLFAVALLTLIMEASANEHFKPGIAYYFDTFDPAQKPWNPGYDLNYEEVFKNYEFYEVIFSASGKELTVNRYIRNNKSDSVQYLLDPDGSISRKP